MNDPVEKIFLLQKLERSQRRWRFIALLVLLIFGISFLSKLNFDQTTHTSDTPFIAHVDIHGLILEDQTTQDVLADIAKDDQAKALIIHVDSPGGTMTGGLATYHAIRHVAENKPVAVVLGTVAASAGYLVALAGDQIFTNEATLTGSVGVFMPMVDVTGLADKIGIKSDDIVSGELKAVTSPLWSRDEKDRAYLQSIVNELNTVFYRYVQTRRPQLSPETLNHIKDGRALVGTQALAMQLVDGIGNINTAKIWLEQETETKELKIIHYSLEDERGWLAKALEGRLIGSDLSALLKPAVWALWRS